jgi:hypothetical protein
MWKYLRWRYFFLLLTLLVVCYCVEFVYRKNNICGPGEQTIQSDAQAIERAKTLIHRARYVGFGRFDGLDMLDIGLPRAAHGRPGNIDFSQPDCCKVTRTRSALGVIIWEVDLKGVTTGEPTRRRITASILLSNCGAIFPDDSGVTAYSR